uniref:phenylalanine--tRNA ligase n=1 Tax=Polysiphonia sertularioides TaxID=945028 RepID=A0A1Z1MG73_9FLOR|nr:Phenylalanine-tRNA ligase beta subunit [Polysiphonia sertularioides]
MKFSWNLTNSFLKAGKTSLKGIEDKLILSGLEIENIETLNEDKILDISITTNRKEIDCAFSLAREISLLTNNAIKTKVIKHPETKLYKKIQKNSAFKYVRIHHIKDLKYLKISAWIKQNLKVQCIEEDRNLYDIQKYMKIKWGQTFGIIEYKTINEVNKVLDNMEFIDYKEQIRSLIAKTDIDIGTKLLVFMTTQNIGMNRNSQTYSAEEFYENYYIDALSILSTATKITIGKYYESYKKIDIEKKVIEISKNKVDKSLGNIGEKQQKFLHKQDLIDILEKMRLSPLYLKNKKSFLVQVPKYRSHDLKRDIDIIEEIGKVYEFKYFYDNNNKNILRGNQAKRFIILKEIRRTLRSLGLSEIITCSTVKNKGSSNNTIEICNSINKTQKVLRNSIVDNLLDNFEYNLKHFNKNLSIFEIGKVFNKQNNHLLYNEERYIGGLISNDLYIRKDWLDNPGNFNIFHMKGIIELFSKKIKAEVILRKTSKNYNNNRIIERATRIGVYDKETNDLIGILGKVRRSGIINNQNNEKKIYGFEINLNKLIQTVSTKGHLKYTKKAYSRYPSITRDISIKADKETNLKKIYQQIIDVNRKLTESVEAFNEYTKNAKDKSKKTRFIGIRITYRSNEKTLDTKDIESIDNSLREIANKLN